MMPARLIRLLAVLVLAPATAMAQDTVTDTLEAASAPVDTELRSLRAMSMGGAFVGGGGGAGAVYHNPAGILTVPVYEAVAAYQRNFGSDTNAIGSQVADAKTNPSLAAAFTYSFGFGRDEGLRAAFDEFEDSLTKTDDRIRNHDIRAGLAFPVVPQRVALGVGMHYVNYRSGSWRHEVEREIVVDTVDDQGNPDGGTTTRVEVSNEKHEISAQGISLDAGVLAQATDNISLGFAARNLLEIDGYPRGRRLESGVGGHFDALHFEVAWFAEQDANDEWAHGVAVGAEYVVQNVPIRAGYRYDGPIDSSIVSTGIGFRTERVGGDIAYEQNVTDTDDRRFATGIALYF